jgi:hypothetical protein
LPPSHQTCLPNNFCSCQLVAERRNPKARIPISVVIIKFLKCIFGNISSLLFYRRGIKQKIKI